MKTERLIGIITILLQRDKVTAPELAERFEVSRRTINRDIEALCKAGIPLVTEQGYGGGISVEEGYKIDKTFFTEDELQSVFAGLEGMDSVSDDSRLKMLLEKLSAKDRRITTDNVIMIDLASHYRDSLAQKIGQIKSAVLEKRLISFMYYYEKGDCRRTIEPYRLIFKWSSWYVFGYCTERKAFRLFKLNRLWNLRILSETFSARELPAWKSETFFENENIRLKAFFEESEKYRLIEEYGGDCFSRRDDGTLLFERDFVNYGNMRNWILSFGDKVLVIEPKELKEDICRRAENLLKKYRRT